MLQGPVLPFAQEHLELYEPGGPKEQVRAGGRPAGWFGKQVGKRACLGAVVGGVKSSVPGGELGFPKAEV